MPAQGLDPTAKPGNSTSMPTDDSGGASVPNTPKKKPYDQAQKQNLEQRVDQEAGKLKQNVMNVNHMVGFKTIAQAAELCDRCGNPPIGGITKTVGNQQHCLNCVLEPTSTNTTHKEAGWKAVTTARVVATPSEDRHARPPRN